MRKIKILVTTTCIVVFFIILQLRETLLNFYNKRHTSLKKTTVKINVINIYSNELVSLGSVITNYIVVVFEDFIKIKIYFFFNKKLNT